MKTLDHILRWLAGVSFGGVAVLAIVASVLHSHGDHRVLVLLTLLGLGIACILAVVHLRLMQRFRALAWCGLASIVLSQAGYNILVWSGWKTQTTPWRLWWVFMVASLFCTHLILLRSTPRTPVSRAASISAAAAAVAIAALAFKTDLLGSLPLLWKVAIWLPVAMSTVTTATVVVQRFRAGHTLKIGPAARRSLLVASHLLVLLVGLYIGSANREIRPAEPTLPSALANLDAADMDTQLEADLEQLRTIVAGLDELGPAMARDVEAARDQRSRENRSYLLPQEDENLRWHFVTYLSYRTALLRLVGTYAGFEAVRDPQRRAKTFMLGYAAAMAVYRSGVELIRDHGDIRLERRKLNEAEPAWGIPAGMFDRVYESVSAAHHVELCEEMAAYYDHRKQQWQDEGIWNATDFEWIDTLISRSLEAVRSRQVDRHRRWLELFVEKVRSDAYTPMYAVQSVVADWIGDIRIVDRPRFIDLETIAEVKPRLRPGDIILERRTWNASNAFLPGFWPHAALYVGTVADLETLGILEAPDVASRLPEFTTPSPEGHAFTIIEALGEGVIFNTLEHSLHADYVAVLRPRLEQSQIGEAIVRAFRHQGKAYDFEFDFFTSDKLVCTELVYRSYQDLLDFQLLRVMGRDTLPALEMVHKYARERNTADQELDLVFFLDADAARGTVFFADEGAFIASAARPREFNE